ncbi:hypothetical protein BWP33_05690 [Simonsiella muelleri ATCC 29453]|nr:hypothetical protein [Simonsiella muelleri]AUX61349.1 hypothetical protein BWP33_05690 [Simonsiella muelleri ATCC 29453]
MVLESTLPATSVLMAVAWTFKSLACNNTDAGTFCVNVPLTTSTVCVYEPMTRFTFSVLAMAVFSLVTVTLPEISISCCDSAALMMSSVAIGFSFTSTVLAVLMIS